MAPRSAWGKLGCWGQFGYKMSPIKIYIFRLVSIPLGMQDRCIDVASADVPDAYPLDAWSPRYNLREVSGVSLSVQAEVCTQVACAKAIEEAVVRVELQRFLSKREIAFACDGGTHRSLACGFLLHALAYPRASILPGTRRTVADCDAHATLIRSR